MSKVVVWFSCGATSAIAAKMTVQNMKDHEIKVCYCDPGAEHEDNKRFLEDVQRWIGYPITILKHHKYKDIWEVFELGYLVGVYGAECTRTMKKRVRQVFEKEWQPDYQVFGFDAGENKRANTFRKNNPEVNLITPLINGGGFDWCQDVDKRTCLGLLQEAGIEVPAMYRLGFTNANCIGCVKGQSGYWNQVRRTHPEVFDRMAKVERKLDVAINKTYVNGERIRVFLDELDPETGRHEPMGDMSCDLLCGLTYQEVFDTSLKEEEK